VPVACGGQADAGPVAATDRADRGVPFQVADRGVDPGVQRRGDVGAQCGVAERPQQAEALRRGDGQVVADHHGGRLSRVEEPLRLRPGHQPAAGGRVLHRRQPGAAGPPVGAGFAGEPAQVPGADSGQLSELDQGEHLPIRRNRVDGAARAPGRAVRAEQRLSGDRVPPGQQQAQLLPGDRPTQPDQLGRRSARLTQRRPSVLGGLQLALGVGLAFTRLAAVVAGQPGCLGLGPVRLGAALDVAHHPERGSGHSARAGGRQAEHLHGRDHAPPPSCRPQPGRKGPSSSSANRRPDSGSTGRIRACSARRTIGHPPGTPRTPRVWLTLAPAGTRQSPRSVIEL
jgi:hypothetical protein